MKAFSSCSFAASDSNDCGSISKREGRRGVGGAEAAMENMAGGGRNTATTRAVGSY